MFLNLTLMLICFYLSLNRYMCYSDMINLGHHYITSDLTISDGKNSDIIEQLAIHTTELEHIFHTLY